MSKPYEIGSEIRLWSAYVPEKPGQKWKKLCDPNGLIPENKKRCYAKISVKNSISPYVVATNSGTSSLRASLAMLGVGPGDEVVSTPYTFIATNTSILEQGAIPVFADIQYETLDIDPESIVKKLPTKQKR